MIWLIGSKGMLASEIAYQLKDKGMAFIGTGREVDVTDRQALYAFHETHRDIDVIINCAAYTSVDRQEDDGEKAALINAEGPANIAETARKFGSWLIHISTDYVFDGNSTSPYTEDMAVCPSCVYGTTKAEGEKKVLSILPEKSFIIRTSWLYGFDGKNFVYTMTRLMSEEKKVRVVNDQKGTPTFAGDLADAIILLVEKINLHEKGILSGIYHFSDMGEITWYDFARAIYTIGREKGSITSDCIVEPCTSEDMVQKAKRPAYSVLCKDKISRSLGISIPDWKQSLEYFMSNPRFSCKLKSG